jgi:hypothetical protein
MNKNKLPILLMSALLTTGISAGAIAKDTLSASAIAEETLMAGEKAEDTLTASTQNAPISAQAQQLATAIQAANGDVALIKQALKAAATTGMNPDEILAIALANGVDPAIVSEAVEDTQTAGGGGFGAAPAPAGPGFGGGSGGGAGTISSN